MGMIWQAPTNTLARVSWVSIGRQSVRLVRFPLSAQKTDDASHWGAVSTYVLLAALHFRNRRVWGSFGGIDDHDIIPAIVTQGIDLKQEYHSGMSQDGHTGGSRLSRNALSEAVSGSKAHGNFLATRPDCKGDRTRQESQTWQTRMVMMVRGKMENRMTNRNTSKSRIWIEICSRGTLVFQCSEKVRLVQGNVFLVYTQPDELCSYQLQRESSDAYTMLGFIVTLEDEENFRGSFQLVLPNNARFLRLPVGPLLLCLCSQAGAEQQLEIRCRHPSEDLGIDDTT
ncbi:hypothetical protein ARMGADRAFT_1057243, partial [Armillaria gallica]